MDFNQKQKNLLFGALGILSLGGIVSIVSADMGEIRMNSDFNYAPQHIEEVVFVPDGATRYDTDKLIHMNLQGGIITVSDSIVAGTSGGNSMSGVENSFILGGKENKITATNTTSGSIIGGGSGNKIENSNYAIILGGKDNTISAQSNESIILGGEGNSVEKGKGIIIGNRNRITNKQNGKETVVIGNNIAVTGSDNVLMGKDYQFSGTNSFVWSTKNEAITGENEFIIKNTHGMAINLEENDTDGIALALKGALKIGEGNSDLTGNIEGAIKRMGSCLCYNDGKNWKPTKSDLICGIMCRSEKPVPGPTPNTCLSGVLLKSASNISGDYRNCIGVSGTDIITITATNCHTGFYFFSGTNTATQISGKTYEGTGVCKEMTQYANCEGTKISSNETLYFPSSIQQTWSGTMQEFLGRAQWYYNDTLISGTCAYTCNTSKGYQYKLDTADGVCRKLIVTFDPSSKTGSTQGTITTTQKEYASGAKLGTNNPNRKGYQFSGWYVKETAYVTDSRGKPLSNDKFPAGTNVNANTLVRTDLLLGAKWNAHTYKIKYVLNGGTTGSAHPTSATFDQEFTVDHPTKTGFAFAGWDITGMDDTSHSYDNATSTATTLSNITAKRFKNLTAINGATITFSAKWSQNTYTISYNDSQCVNNAGTYPTTASFGQTFTVSNPAVKEGYTFKGWTIEGMDTTSHIVGGKTMSTTTSSGITGTTFKDLTSVKNQQVHFTAVCEKKKFLFDLNGYLDGVLSGFLGGYGTCDIYINGDLKYNDDHIGQVIENIPYGSTYEIKDCKANEGYEFMGGTKDIADNHGKMSGTFTNSDIRVAVIFNTKKPDPVNGKCATTENSCISGAVTNKNETSTTYTWTCSGSNGGTSVSCQTCKEHYHQDGTSCKGDQMNCPTSTLQNANLGATSYTFAGEIKTKWTQKTSGTLGACEYQCKPHFTGANCHGEALPCSGTKPENTLTGTELYTFAGQEKSWTYTGSKTDFKECEFTCKEHYTRNATTKKCEADTQTGTCTGLPDHAQWNVSTFKQTWNGSIWDPAQKVGVLATTGECSYSCNTGYEGTNCTAKTITVKYTNGTDITTGTATYDQNYTLLSAPTKEGYSFLGRSGENKLYSGGDTLSKTLINKAITGGKSSIDFEAVWKKDYDTATLVPGSEFNVIIKKLAGANNPIYDSIDTNIQSIQRASSLPSKVTTTLISIKDSIPIYAWYDQGTIYYYSESAIIFMNKDSHAMFHALSSVKDIDLSSINTSNVTDMHSMFSACDSLTGLDVSHFDTSNVTDMAYMFGGCKNLINLDVKNFDTSTVTNMNSMFKECKKLTNLDVSHFDTSKVTEMQNMFYRCSSLTGLDVSHFDTSNVTDMHNMFYLCSSLTGLDVSHFDTSNVTDMHSMFNNCSSLTNLDVSHFNTSRVSNMYGMFEDCRSLTSLDVSHFDTSNVTDMHSMFEDCRSLTSLDVSHFNTSRVSNMYDMFSYCDSLIGLDVSHFDTSKVIDMTEMFYGCSSLTNLDLSNFNTSNVKRIDKMFGYNSNLTTIYASEKFTTNAVETDTNMFESTPKLVGGNGTKWDSSKIDKTMAKIDKPGQEGYFTDKDESCTHNSITVTFDNQGATTPGTTSVEITYGETVLTPITLPTKTDEIFRGYFTETGGNGIQRIDRDGRWVNTTNSTFTRNTTLYAQWVHPVIITFRVTDNGYFDYPTLIASGYDLYQTSTACNSVHYDYCNSHTSGSGFCFAEGTVLYKCNTRGLENATYNSGNALTKTYQNIQRNDYNYIFPSSPKHNTKTMNGWFTAPVGGTEVTEQMKVTSDITLYTHWTTSPINGQCDNDNLGSCTRGESTSVIDNATTHQWERTCKGENNGTTAQCSQERVYTLTFNTLGGNDISSQTGLYGGSRKTVTAPKRAYSQFNGWIDANDNSYSLPTSITGDLVLYADWECESPYVSNKDGNGCEEYVEEYDIIYNSEGGTIIPSEIRRPNQNNVVTGSTPELEFHIFSGWNTSRGGTGKRFYAGNKIEKSDINIASGSLNLYAQWNTGTAIITFQGMGGTIKKQAYRTSNNRNIGSYLQLGGTYDSDLLITDTSYYNAQKTGYTFKGWYTATTGGNKITHNIDKTNASFNTNIYYEIGTNNIVKYQDQTYYAQWESNCWTGYQWYKSGILTTNIPPYGKPSNPYSGESYTYYGNTYTWTCPSKDRCSTRTRNTCADFAEKCDNNDNDNTWMCYVNDPNDAVECIYSSTTNYQWSKTETCWTPGAENRERNGHTTTSPTCNSSTLNQYRVLLEHPTLEEYMNSPLIEDQYKTGGNRKCGNYQDVVMGEYCFGQTLNKVTKGGTGPCKNTTIIYNLQGGTWNENFSQQKTFNSSITLYTTTPKKTHYKFLGWSTGQQNNTVSYHTGDIYSSSQNLNLYAIWTGENIIINYWENADQDMNTNYHKVRTEIYHYEDSSYTGYKRKREKNGYYFSGRYTTPQQNIPVYGVDEKAFSLTPEIVGIGNRSANNAQKDAITKKGITGDYQITSYKELDTLYFKTNYTLYTGFGTTTSSPNQSGTINLYAWYKYDRGIMWDSNYGSSKRGKGDWAELKDTVNENRSQWDFYQAVGRRNCNHISHTSCNGNWYGGKQNYDYIGIQYPTYSKGSICKLSENLPYPVGNLNFRFIQYRDLSNGWDRFQAFGCYFTVGGTDSDWRFLDTALGTLSFNAGRMGGLSALALSNPWTAAGGVLVGAAVAVISWFWDNPKHWTYVFSQDQVFALNNDSGRNWAKHESSIQDFLKAHNLGSIRLAHTSKLPK